MLGMAAGDIAARVLEACNMVDHAALRPHRLLPLAKALNAPAGAMFAMCCWVWTMRRRRDVRPPFCTLRPRKN